MINKVMFLLLILVGFLSYAEANPPRGQKARFFSSLEYFTISGADDKWEDNVNSVTNAAAILFDSAEGSFNSLPGYGGRIGIMFPIDSSYFEVGGSLGYILGPSADFTVNAQDLFFGPQKATGEIETRFTRFLAEGASKIPVSNNISLRFGFGIGLAKGKIEETDMYSGSVVGLLGTKTFSKSWNGITWEISPSLVFDMGTYSLDIGIRYVDFPSLGESEEFSKFDWNPLVFFAGLAF